MPTRTHVIPLASLASLVAVLGCIPDRKPISRPPYIEPTKNSDQTGEPSVQGGASEKNNPAPKLPSIASSDEATKLAAQCGPDGGDQTACVRLGKYWQAQSDKNRAFVYFSRGCDQVVKQGLQLAEENSGCSDAMSVATADDALEYRIITCGIYTLNPICVDLCRMEIGIPNETTSVTTTLPAWWSSAEPRGERSLVPSQVQTSCFADSAPWFGDATSRTAAQRNAALCFSATPDASACRSAATAFQESLSTLNDATRTAARRCSAIMHDAACLSSKELAITKAPFTTQSCTLAASKYAQLFATKAVPQSDQRRAAALYCRAGIVAVGTSLRSSAGSGVEARCVDVLASPTAVDNVRYVEGCRQLAAFKAKAFGNP
jgi:hypothetical protein